MNLPNNGNGYEIGDKIWELGFLSGYNLSIFIGIILSFLTVAYFWRRQKYSWENLQIILILTIPFSIVGARLYTLIFDGGWENWYNLSGLSIYGGVLGAVIPASIFLWFRRRTIDYRTALSIILPTVLIGQAIGRWGNFQNHELYGKVVSEESLNWMTSLKEHMFIWDNSVGDAFNNTPQWRAPVFFYESMLNFLGYFLLVWVLQDRNWAKPGVNGVLYMVWYGIVRLSLQTQRDSSPINTSYIGNSNVSLNLVVSAILITTGLLIAIWWQFLDKLAHEKFSWIPYKEYELIKPKKEVRRFWIGKKYTRTFWIWIPFEDDETKWSKREINAGKRNKNRTKNITIKEVS